MTEASVPKTIHASHRMGVDINTHTKKLYDVCTVCHECICHSSEALLTACDDISWLINPKE